ncbi:MAG: hypothetical protein IPJ88_16470 [Myxococcales bacterium]|nr:MAG: hypothetical protein IPJ88_16470 [Myxococcales bacterium]
MRRNFVRNVGLLVLSAALLLNGCTAESSNSNELDHDHSESISALLFAEVGAGILVWHVAVIAGVAILGYLSLLEANGVDVPQAVWDTTETMVNGAEYIAENAWPTISALASQVSQIISLLAQSIGRSVGSVIMDIKPEFDRGMMAADLGLPNAADFGTDAFRAHIEQLIAIGGHPGLATPNPNDPNDPSNKPDWCNALITGARTAGRAGFEFSAPSAAGATEFLSYLDGIYAFDPNTSVARFGINVFEAVQQGSGSICKLLMNVASCSKAQGIDTIDIDFAGPAERVVTKMTNNFGNPTIFGSGIYRWTIPTSGFTCVDGLSSGNITAVHYIP